jgi:phage-related protein
MLIQEVGNGLWEVRSNLPNGRIARVMFCIHDRRAVLLYSFIKKTQKTPKPDMNLTLRRKRELER